MALRTQNENKTCSVSLYKPVIFFSSTHMYERSEQMTSKTFFKFRFPRPMPCYHSFLGIWVFLFLFVVLTASFAYAIQFTKQKYIIQWFLVYTQSCITIITMDLETVHHHKKKPYTYQQLFTTLPQLLETNNLFSVPIGVSILDS